ncbi:exonuclease 1 [Encephalitozoon intestinalis ATCC 50506]|uniref:Exonuclease 1 n=1 Tax=Encephalitozoon intestinalis (strain ATCC 50506) TaxID=876142 RepID=E0SAD8_ENCIT|nr:exonuclease 1 [Encephalitozoon intestinalis ATCC 50506]ADM12563.1 exonuclease 1 [Encephalitozoon intestinalis ATCC 50506]UTX46419.1 exonuclease 1 [Encephalitozoon intestinalis]
MGISGLLPIVASKLVKMHISSYRHKRLGIDGHAWLYQILSCVAEEMFFRIPTKRYVSMFEEKVKLLENYGITPIIVLDGDLLSSKEETNRKRQIRKEKSRKEAEYWLMKNDPEKAKAFMRQCISVTRGVVSDITKMLERIDVEYIISPYESDAQLCYLERIGYIDYILTEDSDLIPYGSNRILYKFDNTFVREFSRSCLAEVRGKDFEENILDISILSGCDYLSSIQGVGIVTAHKLLSRERTIERVVEYLKHRKPVPKNYLDDFFKARKTFLYQIVYDPIERKRRYLQDVTEEMEFLGSLKEEEYKVEEGPLGLFFKSCMQTKTVKRHFVPSPKKVIPEVMKIKRREEFIKVDAHIHSPYFK